jgi:hypothetical protein
MPQKIPINNHAPAAITLHVSLHTLPLHTLPLPLRVLLTKFTFGLADNIRWMPTTARKLFVSEVNRVNKEGQKLILDLLGGDIDAFIDANRTELVTDINGMHMELGRSGQVSDRVITEVVDNLKDRLRKVGSANSMPKLSYSVVRFSSTDNAIVSPWGQAFSLLADVAAYPRKVLTDSFFLRGLKVPEEALIEAMNVADDALLRDLRSRGIRDRCKAELNLLTRSCVAVLQLATSAFMTFSLSSCLNL